MYFFTFLFLHCGFSVLVSVSVYFIFVVRLCLFYVLLYFVKSLLALFLLFSFSLSQYPSFVFVFLVNIFKLFTFYSDFYIVFYGQEQLTTRARGAVTNAYVWLLGRDPDHEGR